MVNYLIPYVDPRKIGGHEDPFLEEFTYGDVNDRGRWLREKVEQGDFLFFHTHRKGAQILTAYYFVEKVMPTEDAKKDKLIIKKYKNPHLHREILKKNDTLVFGNPIYSKILRHPLVIDEAILNKLSRKPKSIYRPWVKLSAEDVEFLLSEIEKYENESYLKDTFLSSTEVEQLVEEDIESFVESNPGILDNNLKSFKRQYVLQNGERVDLLLKDGEDLVVVEIKKGRIGRAAYEQIKRYIKEIKIEFNCGVRGVIVCSDISPAFEDFFAKKLDRGNVKVYLYSWKFNLRHLQFDM